MRLGWFTLLVLLACCLLRPSLLFAEAAPLRSVASWSAEDGTLRLKGPWQLHWSELLTPGMEPEGKAIEVMAGQRWNGHVDAQGRRFGSHGFASYRIRLTGFTPHPDGYQIGLRNASTAYRIFLYPENHPEQALEAHAGKVGRSPEQTEPSRIWRSIRFHPQGSDEIWVLLIQISNFQHERGGLWQMPELTRGDGFETQMQREMEQLTLAIGIMGMVALYSLMLYFRRRQDKGNLMLAVMSVMGILRGASSCNLFFHVLPHLPYAFLFELQYFFEYLTLAGGVLSFLLFVHFSFREQSQLRLVKLLAWPLFVLTIAPTFLSLALYTKILNAYIITIWLSLTYCIVVLVRATLRKNEGAHLALAGSLAMVMIGAYDLLSALDIVPKFFVIQYGLSIFLFIQSQVIAHRFAKAFETAEKLQNQLKEEVERQTDELRSVMENIQQGVFVILGDLSIQGHYSRHLEDILGITDLAGRAALDVLFADAYLNREQISLASSTLIASLMENSIVWDMNAGNLPNEIRKNVQNSERILDLDWHPIINRDDKLVRILVTVRDVTQIRVLQAETRTRQSEFDMLLELLQADRTDLLQFFEHGLVYMNRCENLLRQSQLDKLAMGSQLFMLLHTFKGLARTHQLRRLTSAVHDIEHGLAEQQKQQWKTWDLESTRLALAEVRQLFNQYLDLVENKLGWSTSKADLLTLSRGELHDLDRALRPILLSQRKDDPSGQFMRMVQDLLGRHLYTHAEDILNPLKRELRTLAAELSKPEPQLVVRCEGIRLTRSAEAVLRGALVHLLRNSMDHGIELPEQRVSQGKPPQGQISISIFAGDGQLHIEYADDGKGLTLPHIQQQAVQMGLINVHEKVQSLQLANLVFMSGFTTRAQATEISGRGVGMDAVRTLFTEAGGTIELELLLDEPDANGCIPFRIRGRLPETSFMVLDELTQSSAA